MNRVSIIRKVNGPVVVGKNIGVFFMGEMVKVGEMRLVGEIVSLDEENVTIQVYEETTGLKPGDPFVGTGRPLSVILGPGLIGNIYDGIQRPLGKIEELSKGFYIGRGIETFPLDNEVTWEVEMLKKVGDTVEPGEFYAKVRESESIIHRLMIPKDVRGKVIESAKSGKYRVKDVVMVVKDEDGEKHEIKLYQSWPVRTPRFYREKLMPRIPLITGQRVIDMFFPIAKGGSAAIPGGFGTGKTMTQHQLAKWADADVIVYIGCGERGNEMTEVLTEFPKLVDPRTGKSLMDRTILIANTSNMPVSAREASIYTGVTIAEYYRDMGYNVAIMADSTSRWAEALREISGRLEEIPAEEGYPAYLSSRIGGFYERAGKVVNLNGSEGSVTIIGAVSPPGGDLSDPVVQHTKRFVKCFWALDRDLAYSRHYPSINWLTSYSDYTEDLDEWFRKNVDENFSKYRKRAMELLNEDDRLQQIIKIMGEDVLPDDQKLVVSIARMIKVGILQQNAYSEIDSFCSLKRGFMMLKIVMDFYDRAVEFVKKKVALSQILKEDIVETMMRMKEMIGNDELEKFEDVRKMIDSHFEELERIYGS